PLPEVSGHDDAPFQPLPFPQRGELELSDRHGRPYGARRSRVPSGVQAALSHASLMGPKPPGYSPCADRSLPPRHSPPRSPPAGGASSAPTGRTLATARPIKWLDTRNAPASTHKRGPATVGSSASPRGSERRRTCHRSGPPTSARNSPTPPPAWRTRGASRPG